jgi:hypothetical protein
LAEVDNDNFLDYEGLTLYDEQIKDYINTKMIQLLDDISELTKTDVDDLLELIESDSK